MGLSGAFGFSNAILTLILVVVGLLQWNFIPGNENTEQPKPRMSQPGGNVIGKPFIA
jgi:hypothetical protein